MFNRITCLLSNATDIEEFLTYELAPQPPSLFKDGVMRKPTKSSLGNILKSYTEPHANIPGNAVFVVDGGHLLHTVVWPEGGTYRDVCNAYITYTQNHFGGGSTIVFDGYASKNSTKECEHRRRAMKKTSSDIMFDLNMPTTTSQASFLANSNNKKRIINFLHEEMLLAGFHVRQAEADADSLIISTALTTAEIEQVPVIVAGSDTDLLVMLVAQAPISSEIYMLCSQTPLKLFQVKNIQLSIGETSKHVMSIHALTGCDTVSAIHRQGKRKVFNHIHNKRNYYLLDTFTNKYSTHYEVQAAGEVFIKKLYGAEKYNTLDNYRHIAYRQSVRRASLGSSFDLANLPPTSAAAKQHSFRAYHTVQG